MLYGDVETDVVRTSLLEKNISGYMMRLRTTIYTIIYRSFKRKLDRPRKIYLGEHVVHVHFSIDILTFANI